MKKTPYPRTRDKPEARASHFMTVWLDDPSLKRRMHFFADLDGRSRNGWLNHYVVKNAIEPYMAELYKKLPADLKIRHDEAARGD